MLAGVLAVSLMKKAEAGKGGEERGEWEKWIGNGNGRAVERGKKRRHQLGLGLELGLPGGWWTGTRTGTALEQLYAIQVAVVGCVPATSGLLGIPPPFSCLSMAHPVPSRAAMSNAFRQSTAGPDRPDRVDRGLCSVGNSGREWTGRNGSGVSEWSLHRSLHRRCQGESTVWQGSGKMAKVAPSKGGRGRPCVSLGTVTVHSFSPIFWHQQPLSPPPPATK